MIFHDIKHSLQSEISGCGCHSENTNKHQNNVFFHIKTINEIRYYTNLHSKTQ